MDQKEPADGVYDLLLRLFDDPNHGQSLPSSIEVNDVDVMDAYFTVELDFASTVFDGSAKLLHISVQPGDSTDDSTALVPRQQVTPAPYAIYAKTAGGMRAGSVAAATGCSAVSGRAARCVSSSSTISPASRNTGSTAAKAPILTRTWLSTSLTSRCSPTTG
jgi:hypothetical protein